MGKSQKKRSMRRHNPVRVPDSHLPKGLASANATSEKRDNVLPVMQKLESAEASDRVWACAAVCNLIQNDPSTRRLFQGKNIVKALITRLSDSVDEVVVEAAGALRNLCLDAGHELCAEMYNKNILPPLTACITKAPQVSTALDVYLKEPKRTFGPSERMVMHLSESIITILASLAETSNKSLTAVNNLTLVPFLMSFLQARQKLPIATVTASAQCLFILSDDNEPAIEALRTASEYVTTLIQIAHSPDPQTPASNGVNGKSKKAAEATTEESQPVDSERKIALQIMSCGILRNISPLPSIIPFSAVDLDEKVLLPRLSPLLSISLPAEAARVIATISETPTVCAYRAQQFKNALKTDHKTPQERELDLIEQKLKNVQLALEILTGVCAALPDPSAVTEEAANDNDVASVDEMDVQAEPIAEATNPEAKGSLSRLSSLLSALALPLLSLCHPTPLSFPPLDSPSPHPPTTSLLGTIHIRACECLSNIFLSLASQGGGSLTPEDLQAARDIWTQFWLVLSAIGTQGGPGQETRGELWVAAVGVLWGIARLCKGSLEASEEQIQVIIAFCNSTADEQVKVKCIGTLECIAQTPTAIEANKIVSSYLVQYLSAPAPQAEPLLQTVSALIDIYSDEESPYDINFRQNVWLDSLQNAQDSVRKAVKGIDRRKEGGLDLRARGDEILLNLRGFIKYRRALRL
ncbi:ARM repeat-containing protein [Sistotremastrum niveocremeum HHB9708]|uniref:ARM repeat-containing protein n=1 Tax=Sistotremastrum niveocremeum HHB9708 TaxID=1314777 RepID=A0A164U324_9AGAM|nr:ARM repeat-containing protein [Sistotremastrum niveocremeum HHB9708]